MLTRASVAFQDQGDAHSATISQNRMRWHQVAFFFPSTPSVSIQKSFCTSSPRQTLPPFHERYFELVFARQLREELRLFLEVSCLLTNLDNVQETNSVRSSVYGAEIKLLKPPETVMESGRSEKMIILTTGNNRQMRQMLTSGSQQCQQ